MTKTQIKNKLVLSCQWYFKKYGSKLKVGDLVIIKWEERSSIQKQSDKLLGVTQHHYGKWISDAYYKFIKL